ncbi:MAG: alpha/beta fold hydrolase [Rhodocyclaceae bacterium]
MITRIAGNGPDLALIHGWGLGSAVWGPVLDALAQRCRVHLVTLPGYGLPGSRMDQQSSPAPREEAHKQTLSGQALARTPVGAACSPAADAAPTFIATAAALAEALDDTLPAGCVLCGWSLGGMLALQTAALAPQRVKGLILVGSTPSFTQRADWPHAQPSALLDTFSAAIGADAASALQRFVALLNQGDAQARQLGRAMIKQLLANGLPDTATLLTGLGWLHDVDLRAQIASIATPTLLIHGERDPLMPLAAAHWLEEQLPQARLEVFAGAAHAPFLADPERFTTLVSDCCHEFYHA